jgi:hypothetical protein
MVLSPQITLKNQLYNNWAVLASPPRDATNPETFDPKSVHFTTREYATNPQRIHSFQISVLAGPKKTTPEEVGSVVMYKVEEQIPVHVWAIAGIGDDWETTENKLQNMLDQVDAILRLTATADISAGIQFIRLAPGAENLDDRRRALILHRVVRVTAIYYRTDLTVPGSLNPGTYNSTATYDGTTVYA